MSSPPLPLIVSTPLSPDADVAGLAGTDEIDVEEEDVAQLCAGLGVDVLALGVDPPGAGRERALDPSVVAGDHVVVARRAVAVVAHDHVVRVAERLA